MLENAGEWSALWANIGLNFAPKNAITGNYYTGVNTLLLASAMHSHGFTTNQWMTFKQAQLKGWKVKKGAKSTPCIFYTQSTKEEINDAGEEEKTNRAVMKAFYLFNVEQVEGCEHLITEPQELPMVEKIEAGEAIIKNIRAKGCAVISGGNRACYIPSMDVIEMPNIDQFYQPEHYYSVFFHEATHWTAHSSRLDRDLSGRFGDERYAMEELIAELSSAFTCAKAGIIKTTLEDHAKYLKSWIRVLKNDSKAIFKASTLAQKAHEYIYEGISEESLMVTEIEETKKPRKTKKSKSIQKAA